MPDPRNCPPLIDKNNRLQGRKKGFFDAIGNLGKLEVLNEIGSKSGDIRKGLETVARVSDSVRSGKSVVPGQEGDEIYNSTLAGFANTAIESTENGANVVLDAVGIGRGALDAVNNIDAGVANRALGSAKQIFDQAKQGNFSLDDIPSAFQNLQNLEILVRSIFVPTQLEDSVINELNRGLCLPSPFAIDLIKRAPKNKFSYIVEIQFSPAYAEWNKLVTPGIAFVTKRATRPQVDFQYDEVNMYNYWTQVIKRVQFNPVQMTFYDDNTGMATNFYAQYMRAISPITNKNFQSQKAGVSGAYEGDSMNFTNTDDDQDLINYNLPAYSASVGALRDDAGNPTKGLLERITLYHLGQYGDTITSYHMFNPRITSLQPDELSMQDSGEGSEFTFEFSYDSLFVDPNQKTEEFGTQNVSKLTGGNGEALYPLEIVPTPTGDAGGGGKGGGENPASGITPNPGGNNKLGGL